MVKIQKTIQFSLKTINKEKIKNENYNKIVEKFKKNENLSNKINVLVRRNILSSNNTNWSETKKEIINKIEDIKEKLNHYELFFEKIEKIEDKNSYQINFNLRKLKIWWLFWKWLYYFCKKTNKLPFWKFKNILKNDDKDKFLKYFDNDIEFSKQKTLYHIYKYFIIIRLKRIIEDLNQLKNMIKNENFDKEKFSEIYKKVFYINNNFSTINLYLNWTVIVFEAKNEDIQEVENILKNIKSKNIIENIIYLEDIFKNFNNGYDLWKATLNYKTLYKKSDYKIIDNYKDILWKKEDNDWIYYAFEILETLNNNITEIQNENTILDKVNKIIQIVENKTWKKLSLEAILNSINNKSQLYHDFINKNIKFSNIWLKQRLRFALTVLVDVDVYKNGKFHEKAKILKEEAEKVLSKFDFKYYNDFCDNKVKKEWYKNLTEKIKNWKAQEEIKKMAKDRWNLFTKSKNYTYVNKVYKELSAIKNALKQYIQRNEDEILKSNDIVYFSILWKKDGKYILIFIQKEFAAEFYNYINELNSEGEDVIYMFESITSKSIKKLFEQPYSKEHPFFHIKKDIFNNKKENQEKFQKNIDELKFSDLKCKEIKMLFLSEKDIAWKENWRSKYKELYSNLEKNNNIENIINIIDSCWFYFNEKFISIIDLEKKNGNIIVWYIENGNNSNITKNHINYFENAINKMIKWETDIKINPEIFIRYTPESSDIIKKEKIDEKKGKISEEALKEGHRYWRNYIKIWFPIEFKIKDKRNKDNNFRVIWIDRWEKKLATLSHLEILDGKISILPIQYYEEIIDINNKKSYKEHLTYFLDCANYKVSKINWKKVIIKFKNEDNNFNMKKYEYLVRLQKTLWLKENQDTLKNIIENNDDINLIIKEIEEKFFNTYGIKKYIKKRSFFDKKLLYMIEKIINAWKNFDRKDIPTDREEQIIWYNNKMITEVNHIPLRQNISSQISWIIDFLYNQNENKKIETYMIMENLHNSSWRNKTIKDKISWTNIINQDFIEYSHNKISQTSVYNKIEQSIIKKLQLHNNWKDYINYSTNDNKNFFAKLSYNLKNISNKKYYHKDSYSIEYELFKSYLLQNILFVSPFFTSNKCPKCGIDNRNNAKNITWHTSEKDIIKCSKCNFSSKNAKSPKSITDKVSFEDIYNVVWTWDENWSLQTWIRWIEYIKKIKKLNNLQNL